MPEITEKTRESWWRRWLVKPVLSQLTAGISSERIAWTISAGMVLGIFPIMGTPTLVCLLTGWVFKLNQPIMQVFKELVYPLHLALILVFIRLGEFLFDVPLTSFSVSELLFKFKADPLKFVYDFGMAGCYGIFAWLLIAPIALLMIKVSVMPIIQRLEKSFQKSKEAHS
jgi:uncharacterized protein (DUF2062 family)